MQTSTLECVASLPDTMADSYLVLVLKESRLEKDDELFEKKREKNAFQYLLMRLEGLVS